MKLIDKDALIAEIERRKNEEVDYDEDSKNFASYADQIHYSTLDSIEDFINTIEVKGVDLEKEIQDHIKECLDVKFPTTDIKLIKQDVAYTARKFFELGLKAQKGGEK